MLAFTFYGLDHFSPAYDRIQVYTQLNPKAGLSTKPGLHNRNLGASMDIPGA